MIVLRGNRCPGCDEKIEEGDGREHKINLCTAAILICSDCAKDCKCKIDG